MNEQYRDQSIDHGTNDINLNPMNEFELTSEDIYVDENGNSTGVNHDDRESETSTSSFWDSPTAAQDALKMILKKQYE